ncbi:MAG: vWA domain-containing protein [Flavobacteriaceae bacterium]
MLIIIAFAISLALVIFQYPELRNKYQRFYLVLAFFRFIGILSLLLLLINPKFIKDELFLVKSKLIILVDDSSSIADSGQKEQLITAFQDILDDFEISDRFELQTLKFGRELTEMDSFAFNKRSTDIYSALNTIRRTYRDGPTAVVLLTDGNQTVGSDYEFLNPTDNIDIYPVVVGDTTAYEDISVAQINTNKYAFLNNQYPVEVLVNYQGFTDVKVPLTITTNGQISYRTELQFDRRNNSKQLEFFLQAETVGVKVIEVKLGTLPNERNSNNNSKSVAVEVIDEKTEVFVVSDMNHPDLGMLKKSIENNNQRTVRFFKPSIDDHSFLDRADVLILYQPRRSFEKVYEVAKKRDLNIFTITGTETDWNFLNAVQNSFQKNSFNQTEYVSPVLNEGFSAFDISNFSVDNFPPLQTTLGDLLITTPAQVVLEQRIKGVDLGDPLLCLLGQKAEREAVLFAQDLWKWRLQWYRDEGSFTGFDEFLGKIIFFLATDQTRQRLTVEYDNIYRDASLAKIRAAYFDNTYEFEKNASLTLRISEADNETDREFPLLLKGNYYEADLSGLPAGNFGFALEVEGSSLRRTGQFTILDFDIEKQYATADYNKLERLAGRSGGRSFFPDQVIDLIEDINQNERYLPTQKSEQNVVSLIDFKILLAIVIISFSAEWFIRKYNGLI